MRSCVSPGDMRPRPDPEAEGDDGGEDQPRGGALRIVRARPPLGLAIGLMSAGFFALFFYDALIPLLTREVGHPEQVFGAAIAAVGVGGVAGAALLASAGEGRPFARMGAGYLVAGAAVAALGLAALLGASIPALVFVAIFGVLGPRFRGHGGALPHGAAERGPRGGDGPRHGAGRGGEHDGAPRGPLRGGSHRRNRRGRSRLRSRRRGPPRPRGARLDRRCSSGGRRAPRRSRPVPQGPRPRPGGVP